MFSGTGGFYHKQTCLSHVSTHTNHTHTHTHCVPHCSDPPVQSPVTVTPLSRLIREEREEEERRARERKERRLERKVGEKRRRKTEEEEERRGEGKRVKIERN